MLLDKMRLAAAVLALLFCLPAPGSAQAQQPTELRARIGQGWIYMEAGSLRQAEQAFSAAFETPAGRNTAEVYYAIAGIWWERRNAMAAYMWLSDAEKAARDSYTWDGGPDREWDRRIGGRKRYIENNFTVIKLRAPKRGKPLPPLADPPPTDPLLREFTDRVARVVQEGVEAKVAVQWVLLPNGTYWVGEELVWLDDGELEPSRAASWDLAKDGGKARKDYEGRLTAMEGGESLALALLEERRAMASAEELEHQRRREAEAQQAREDEERLALEAEEARRREAELAERMAREAEEARAREVQERQAREAEEAERLAQEQREELEREEAERRRQQEERVAAEEAERLALEADERRRRELEQQEQLAREEQERRERELADLRRQDEERAEEERRRRDAEEADRVAREERERREAEEATRVAELDTEREDREAEQERLRREEQAERERREAEQAERIAAAEEQRRKDQEWDEARDRMQEKQEQDRLAEEARRRELEQQRASGTSDLSAFRRHRGYLVGGGGGTSVTRLTRDGTEGEVGWAVGGEIGYLIPVKERGVAIGIGLSYANLPVSGCSQVQTRGNAAALHVGPRIPVPLGRRAWLSIRAGLHVGAAGTWPGREARDACAGAVEEADPGVRYGIRLRDPESGVDSRVSYAEVGWGGYAITFGPDLELGAIFGAGEGPHYLGVAGFVRHDQLFAVVSEGDYYFETGSGSSTALDSESISVMDEKASMARFQFGLRGMVMF